MLVALITEGTYPCYQGGVSVWCDQMLTGLSEHTFDVISLQPTGAEPRTWTPPANVRAVHTVALWSGTAGARTHRGFPPTRLREAADAHATLMRCLARPEPWMRHWPAGLLADFRGSLQTLAGFAPKGDVSAVLHARRATDRLLEVWRQSYRDGTLPRRPQPSLSLGAALTINEALAHLLRPLFLEPGDATMCHATANGLSALVALAAKWRAGTPFVLSEHGIYMRERYLEYTTVRQPQSVKHALLNFFQLLCALAYAEADAIVPSADYGQRWELQGGASLDRIRTVHTGVSPELFPETDEEPEAPTIVFLGRIDPLKDLETLIEASAKVHRVLPNARLRIFGPVPRGNEAYRERCEDLVDALGLGNAVTFEGPARSPVEAFQAGHVAVLSSISEGFPYAVMEAMASGRAIVSTLVGGVSEAIGDAGVGVPPRDPGALATACLELLTDSKRRRAMGRAARRRVLNNFTVGNMLNAYRAVYAGVAASNRSCRESAEDGSLQHSRRPEAA